MKHSYALTALVIAALSVTPLSPAQAHGWHRGHDGGGLFFGLAAAGAAITGAAVAIATAPINILAQAAAAPAAPPVYAAPAPVMAYGYPPVYPQQRVVVYHYPSAYYGYPTYAYPQ